MIPDLGTVSECYTVTFRRTSRHSVERLWRAITTVEEVEKWMGYPCRIDLRVGGEWHMDFAVTGGGTLPAVIVRLEEPNVFAYASGLSVIQWELQAAGGGCTYSFSQSGLADRGDGEEILVAGWHGFLDQLEGHLEGRTYEVHEQPTNWLDLQASYRAQLDRALTGRVEVSR